MRCRKFFEFFAEIPPESSWKFRQMIPPNHGLLPDGKLLSEYCVVPPMRILMDSRESADPHPWVEHFSQDVTIERGTLETGDFALAALPDAAVVERKTVGDLLACLGRERIRFEAELKRGRHVGRLVVVCDGSMADLLCEARRRGGSMADASVIGTLAACSGDMRRFSSPGAPR